MLRPESPLHNSIQDRIVRFSTYDVDMLQTLQKAARQWDDSIEFLPARRGGWGLRKGSDTLDSLHSPEKFAEKFIKAESFARIDLVVLIGSGGGSLPRALARRLSDHQVRIAVIEPNSSILLGMFAFNEQIEALDPARIQFFSSLASFQYYLIDLSLHGDRLSILCPDSYQRYMAEEVALVNNALKEAVPIMLGNRQTRTANARPQIRNLLNNIYQKDRCPSIYALKNMLSGVPAILVASGPSLDHNLCLLRKTPPGALILCVNSSLKALSRNEIRPHLVFSNESADISRDLSEAAGRTGDPILVLGDTSNPGFFAVKNLRSFMMYTNKWNYAAFAVEVTRQDVEGLHGGGCAANSMFAAALLFGCDPIVMIGQDLAYSEGRVYANATDYGGLNLQVEGTKATIVDSEGALNGLDEAACRKVTQERTLVPVRAWDGQGQVMSSPNMNMFRLCFQEAGRQAVRQRGVRLVNATEGGAHIEGFARQRLADFLGSLGESVTSPRAIIDQVWSQAPRADPQVIKQGMIALNERVNTFITNTQKLLGLLEKVESALADVGPEHPRFKKTYRRFNEASVAIKPIPILEAWIESQVKQVARDHPVDGTPGSAFQQGKRSLQKTLQGAKSLRVELTAAMETNRERSESG